MLQRSEEKRDLVAALPYAKLVKVPQATSTGCLGMPSVLIYKIHVKHLLFLQLNSV